MKKTVISQSSKHNFFKSDFNKTIQLIEFLRFNEVEDEKTTTKCIPLILLLNFGIGWLDNITGIGQYEIMGLK